MDYEIDKVEPEDDSNKDKTCSKMPTLCCDCRCGGDIGRWCEDVYKCESCDMCGVW